MDTYFIVEELPDDIVATMQIREQWMRRLPPTNDGLEFVVDDVQKWMRGQKLRVAFSGGSPTLHREIAEATYEITNACNLILDFGWEEGTGSYRTWTPSDTTHAAEIRVSFDQKGYFSLVGTDSIDLGIGQPQGPVGGRPNQRSLNLGGFTISRPATWRGTVRHEFLHALAFHHEHQNMRGPCEQAFRWDDDPDYEPTTNANGGYIPDSQGRRSGIYTFLAGAPNYWSRNKVDHNLRTTENPKVVTGPFDRSSIMLYRFPETFYKTLPSDCAPIGDGISLSEGDIRGLQLLYPAGDQEAARIAARKVELLGKLESPKLEMPGVESEHSQEPEMSLRVRRILEATVAKQS